MGQKHADRFYIYTINGKSLLYRYNIIEETNEQINENSVFYNMYGNTFHTIQYAFNIQDETTALYLIKSHEPKDDNALFYQIRKCLSASRSNMDANKHCLSTEIIYLDFEDTFRNIKSDFHLENLKDNPLNRTELTNFEDKGKSTSDTSENEDFSENSDNNYDDYDFDNMDYEDIEMDDIDWADRLNEYLELELAQAEASKPLSYHDLLPYSTKIDNSYRLSMMFAHGIKITFEDGITRTFVPFDKSQSMARDGKIYFINKDILPAVTERLSLGINFRQIPLILSKYYAYRGLYLSSATRIELPKDKDGGENFVLNEETVVVLKDTSYTGKARILSASEFKATNKEQEKFAGSYVLDNNPYEEIEETEKVIDPVFDGEGLISPHYALLINQILNNKPDKYATSFQIRMPFAKGMLHQVDFHGFLDEFCNISQAGYMVKDYFGIERDLTKARIILTDSMFKGAKWLSRWVKFALQDYDPMKYYFEKFAEYEHALYISGTDIPYLNRSLIKLSYQFLNTLLLTKDDYKHLIEEHLDYTADPVSYFKRISIESNDDENMISDDNAEEDFFDDNSSSIHHASPWKNALMMNPDFIHEPYVKSRVDKTMINLKRDIGSGQLLTSGEIRYLSRDLLYFLTDILRLPEDARKKVLEKDSYIDDAHFYMPNCNIDIHQENHYPILRNPHLSRNEQCALRAYTPKSGSIRERYLGHLKAVLMVSYSSFVPNTLGGADFDGDIVKIIDNPIIRDAVLKGAYNMKEHTEYNIENDYNRKLPIINIPSKTGIESVPANETSYWIILNTFSNSVGRISNLAIRIGKYEYNSGGDSSANTCGVLNHYCAECTILTGLEIDACKSGFHPNLTPIFSAVKSMRKENAYDYIDDFLTPFKRYTAAFPYEDKAHFDEYVTNMPDKNSDLQGLELLPYYYREYCILGKYKSKTLSGPCKKKYIYFDFQKDDKWEKALDKTLLQKITGILSYYKELIKFNSLINFQKNNLRNNNWRGYIEQIFSQQYANYDEVLNSKVYDFILKFIADSLDNRWCNLDNAIKRFKSSDWAYLPTEKEKYTALAQILGLEEISDDVIEENKLHFLTNFNNRGYRLLYLMLMECKRIFADDYASILKLYKRKLPKAKNAVSKHLKNIYLRNKVSKTPDDQIKQLLIDACDKDIQKLLNKADPYKAASLKEQKQLKFMLIYKASKTAKCEDYFWSFYSFNTMKQYINTESNNNDERSEL